jgi:hypothetical protein
VHGTLTPGESLIHTYAGHETRITLGPGTAGLNETFTISYEFRPNDQGDLRGIDHFFEITAGQSSLVVPLTVTIRFSDTQEFRVFPSTTRLYRLESNDWVTDGITIINTQVDELGAVITQLGSFGVMGHEGNRIFLPVILRN